MKTLFFTKALEPTGDELADASKLETDGDMVTFRCNRFSSITDLEPADQVAGDIPGAYLAAKDGAGKPLYKVAATPLAKIDKSPVEPFSADQSDVPLQVNK